MQQVAYRFLRRVFQIWLPCLHTVGGLPFIRAPYGKIFMAFSSLSIFRIWCDLSYNKFALEKSSANIFWHMAHRRDPINHFQQLDILRAGNEVKTSSTLGSNSHFFAFTQSGAAFRKYSSWKDFYDIFFYLHLLRMMQFGQLLSACYWKKFG